MMIKTLISSLALIAALGVAMPAYSQVTDQTDQSEEDWRKSRKKSGTSDIYRNSNSNATGVGSAEPLSPVETLPSESRRHLMKERAKAIAESDDGDISDTEFVPSDAAQTDEQLKQDEQEAWDVIVTDMQGSGGEATSDGGPNKVAVTGQNGATPTQGSRGGSTRTLQEIMDAIKSGQTGGGSGSGSGSGGPTSSNQSSQGQSEPGQSASDQSAPGQSTESPSAQGQSDNAQGTASSSDGASQGDGASEGEANAQSDSATEGDAAAWPAATRAEEPLSPLERIRRSRDDQPARGTQRSASDYIGGSDD